LAEQVPLLSYFIKYLGNFVNNSSADLVTRGVFNWLRFDSQEMSPALDFGFFIYFFNLGKLKNRLCDFCSYLGYAE